MSAEIILEDYLNWLKIQFSGVFAEGAAVELIEAGWDSRVLEVGGQWIFRFARRPEIVAQFRKELLLLPMLAGRLPVPLPYPEFARLDDPKYSCMGYRKLRGNALSRKTATKEVAVQVGKFLNSLHGFPLEAVAQLGLEVLEPDRWHAHYLDFYRWVRQNVLPQVSEEIERKVRNLWESFLNSEVYFRFNPVFIHGDLGVEHILIDPVSGRLAGVIDWGDACIGDPALDFTGLLVSCGADFVAQVMESYTKPVDASFWERMAFYRDILPFHQMLYGRNIGEECIFEEGLKAFESSRK